MLAKAAFPSLFFTMAGFLLFLLVTLSVPHIKTIYLMRLQDDQDTALDLGVFGACAKFSRQVAVAAGVRQNDCSSSGLGYTLNYGGTAGGAVGGISSSRRIQLVQKSLSTALVVNPIAAALAGFSFIWALLAWACSSRGFAIVTFISLLLSALFGWIAFAVDIALAIIARNRLRRAYDIGGSLGNGIWLALGGAIALTLGICAAGCGIFGRYSSSNRREKGSY